MTSSLLSTLPPLQGPQGLFSVSRPPEFLVHSGQVGWEGAFFTELVSAPMGRVDHVHEQYCLLRSCAPMQTRSKDGPWTTREPGLVVCRPGERQAGEWRGGALCQFLFIGPERREHALFGRPPRSSAAEGRAARVVERILDALSLDLKEQSPAGSLLGDTLVSAIVCHLWGDSALPSGALGRVAHRRVVDYVEAHLGESLRVATLATLAGLGERQFLRAFRSSLGESPHQYVLRRRVARARLLIDGGASLVDVSQACGFADQSQLTRMFVRRLGVTPGRYRALSGSAAPRRPNAVMTVR